MSSLNEIKISNNSLLAISFVGIVGAAIVLFIWHSCLKASIISLSIQFIVFLITAFCLYRKHWAPFEIIAFGLTLILFLISITIVVSQSAREDVTAFLEKIFLLKWDWMAIMIAGASLVFGACTWLSQENTQKNTALTQEHTQNTQRNTMRITPEIQYEIFMDFFRHTYRNIMVVYALSERMRGKYKEYYPSEEHIAKLRTNEDSIYPEAFVGDKNKCSIVHNLKYNIRNRNIELDIMLSHFKDEKVHYKVKERDMELLKTQIEYSAKRIVAVACKACEKTKTELAEDARQYVEKEAANRNDDDNKELLLEIGDKLDSGELSPLYTSDTSDFIKALFLEKDQRTTEDQQATKKFLRKLNQNIYLMLKRPDMICIIPFDTNKDLINK